MILAKPKRCTECLICMQVCSFQHFAQVTTKRSRIRVVDNWPDKPKMMVCIGCPDHECVTACPHEALSWGEFLELNADKCDSCGACAEACPVNGIGFDPVTGLPLACDTCNGEYMCVKSCPNQALERRGS